MLVFYSHVGEHWYDCISSIQGEVWAHNNCLTLSHFIEVSEPRQGSDWSPVCVLCVSIVLLSTILIFNYGVVPTLFYFFIFNFGVVPTLILIYRLALKWGSK